MAEQTFNEFTKQARIEFVNYINSLEWNNELRTKCEDLLIAYDQMKAKCDGMEEASEINTKALRLQNVSGSCLISYLEWKDSLYKENRGGKVMYDVHGEHKWLNDDELFECWKKRNNCR